MKININILFIVLILLSGCKERNIVCGEDSLMLTTYNDKGESKRELLIIFNICESLLKSDTINMSFFKYTHDDLEDRFLSFNLPKDYIIKKVERVADYHAMIISDSQQVGQYIRLNDIKYSAKKDLPFLDKKKFKRVTSEDSSHSNSDELEDIETNKKVILHNDVIFYPDLGTDKFVGSKFSRITKEDLSKSIDYSLRDSFNVWNHKYINYEREVWKSHIKKYKVGDISKRKNGFTFFPFNVFIKLKIKYKGKRIEKILKYRIHVGN